MPNGSSSWHSGTSLREWRLHNFKSVRDATVPLLPLTVIVGENSAGKSTLLQSIRMAAQAAQARGSVFPLNGEQMRLGTYSETVSAGASEDAGAFIGIGGSFHFESQPGVRPPAAPFRYGTVNARRRRSGELHDGQLTWDIRLGGSAPGQPGQTMLLGSSAEATWVGHTQTSIRSTLPGGGRAPSDGNYSGVAEDGDSDHVLVGVSHAGGFPVAALVETDLVSSLTDAWYVAAQRAQVLISRVRQTDDNDGSPQPSDLPLAAMIAEDINLLLSDIGDDVAALPAWERRLTQMLVDRLSDRGEQLYRSMRSEVVSDEDVRSIVGARGTAKRTLPLPETLLSALDESREFLASKVFHLGPLRMDPQVVYTSAPVGQQGFVGTKGEYCVAVLQSQGPSLVDVPMPRGSTGHNMRNVPLTRAVDAWAADLGIGDAFTTADRGRLGLELAVRQPNVNMPLDLTSVGTGVSQLLPVLVMCLTAPKGSLLLIEQPELHLNPAVQQRLADFLLAVSASGRQLVIETHSEYLVGRLRRRVAEQPGDVQDLVGLMYVERVEGASRYESIRPASDGSLPRWPRGFFDQAAQDTEAMLRASMGADRS